MKTRCQCGARKKSHAALCRRCRYALGGALVNAVVNSYPEESAESIAARLGTTPTAVWNTASRLRRTNPGSIAYRWPGRDPVR